MCEIDQSNTQQNCLSITLLYDIEVRKRCTQENEVAKLLFNGDAGPVSGSWSNPSPHLTLLSERSCVQQAPESPVQAAFDFKKLAMCRTARMR
jgi:hypothetical protein